MLGILIDAALLIFLVAAANDNEQVDWIKAAIVGLVMSVVCGLGLGVTAEAFGPIGFWGGLIPAGALAGLVAWLTLGLTLQRAMIVGACFLGCKVLVSLAFAFLLGG